MKRILLKTTISPVEDDWHIGRFSLLLQELESLRDEHGAPVFSVTARDRSIDANGDVAFDPDPAQGRGRAVAHSSFHHFADYNWDPRLGCPSFVKEPEGDQVLADANALDDIRAYVANAARWLSRDLKS